MPKPTMRKGDVFSTSYGKCVVTEYINSDTVTVRFAATGYVLTTAAGNVRRGSVRDPLVPSVNNLGFVGVGPYSPSTGHRQHSRLYKVWKHMMGRCYSEATRARHPAYADVSVCKRWHNFQNFCADVTNMMNHDRDGFALDKDLLLLGNREYGPEACSFVPQAINNLLIDCGGSRSALAQGVYKPSGKTPRFMAKLGNKYLGMHDTIEEASIVYWKAKAVRVRAMALKHCDDLHPLVYFNLLHLVACWRRARYRVTESKGKKALIREE